MGNSLLPVSGAVDLGEWTHPTDDVEVSVVRLDEFCAANDVASVDVLKTDTQGHDLAALQGAGELLRPARITSVVCEVLFEPVYEGQGDFADMHILLAGNGYRLAGLFEPHRDDRQRIGWADALYV